MFYETEEAKELMHKPHPKVTPHVINQRVTFLYAVEFANRHLRKKIAMFANGDVYFDDTLELARHVNFALGMWKHRIFSISRNEDHGLGHFTSPKISRYYGSHDTFVWLSPLRMRKQVLQQLDYPLGKAGSENRFMYILTRLAKQIVVNPAYSISTWHIHNSNERTYNVKDRVDYQHGRGFKVAPVTLGQAYFNK